MGHLPQLETPKIEDQSRSHDTTSEEDLLVSGTGGKGVYNQWIHCDLIVIF